MMLLWFSYDSSVELNTGQGALRSRGMKAGVSKPAGRLSIREFPHLPGQMVGVEIGRPAVWPAFKVTAKDPVDTEEVTEKNG